MTKSGQEKADNCVPFFRTTEVLYSNNYGV